MAFDLGTQIGGVVDWAKQNWVIIVLVLAVIILLWLFLKNRKPSLKQISRSQVERKNFIERNNKNKSTLRWLYRGDKLMGKIKYLRATHLIDVDKDGIELVVKPCFFGLKGIPDLFSKDFCIIVNKENSDYSFNDSTFDIKESTTFDKLFGIYYDRDSQEAWVKYIRDSYVFATDWETMSSIYYEKGIEQATFSPDNAIHTQDKQLDLEAEKEKRKNLIS